MPASRKQPDRLARPFRPAVLAIAAVWLIYAALTAAFMLVDPYDLYPWGARVRLPHDNGNFGAITLLRAAAKDPTIDTVLIGSSPTMLYTPEDIKSAFPDARRPWNASYLRASNRDRLTVLDEFINYSNARHFIISLDYPVASPVSVDSEVFKHAAYDSDPTNDLSLVTLESLRDTWSAFRTGAPIHGAQHLKGDLGLMFQGLFDKFRRADERAHIRQLIARYRHDIDTRSTKGCADFPMIEALVARIWALTARGARVDVIVPVYSPAMYYVWRAPAGPAWPAHPTALSDQLIARKCMTRALEAIPRTSISSLDQDAFLLQNSENFIDPGHLMGHDNLMRVLQAVEDPRYQLRTKNMEHYLRAQYESVKNFNFF